MFESMYPLFKTCYEMVAELNKEKHLSLTRIEILTRTFSFYSCVIQSLQNGQSESTEFKISLE